MRYKRSVKSRIVKATTYLIDCLSLARNIQALLSEFEIQDFELLELPPITSSISQFPFTEGMLVFLKKAY